MKKFILVLLWRPLHVAARNGLTVVVQELLAKGASVLAVDENGKIQSTFLFILVLYFSLLGLVFNNYPSYWLPVND